MFSCIFSSSYISSIVSPIISDINTIQYDFNNNTEFNDEFMTEVMDNWQKSNNILGMIIRHNELDDLDAIFIRTYEYAKNGNEESFTIESEELIYRLENLIEKESFSFKNLF